MEIHWGGTWICFVNCKGPHVALDDDQTQEMCCSLAQLFPRPHVDKGPAAYTALSLAIQLQLIDIIAFFIFGRFPACGNMLITIETREAPLSHQYHIYKPTLKVDYFADGWSHLFNVDAISSNFRRWHFLTLSPLGTNKNYSFSWQGRSEKVQDVLGGTVRKQDMWRRGFVGEP